MHARAHLLQRIEHAPHRPLAQGRIAVESRRHRANRPPRRSPAGSRCRNCRNRAAAPAWQSRRRRRHGCAKRRRRRAQAARRARAWPRPCAARPRLRAGRRPCVSPTVSAPKIRARCEIDLSPGTRTRPCKGPPRRAVSGVMVAGSRARSLNERRPTTRARAVICRHALPDACAIDSGGATSQVKHRFDRLSEEPDRGQSRARHQARLSGNRAQVLRSQQDAGDFPLYRQGRPHRRRRRARAARTRGCRRSRPAPVAEPEVVAPETADAEFVSLDDAEAEQQGKKKPAVAGAKAEGEEEEVETDETLDDAAFIEEQEEGDPDVTDIIGETIEKEEEQ